MLWLAVVAPFVRMGMCMGVPLCIQDGRTALICAAWLGTTECVRVLVENGADIEATDVVRGMNLKLFCVAVYSRFFHWRSPCQIR